MRIAVLSDIHGNRTAFEAVLADLRIHTPDLILHGGDLADNGSSPNEIVDRIRDLGWLGVMGNTDEMLVRPQALDEFASQSAAPASLWHTVREMAAATRAALGAERLAWLAELPILVRGEEFALVHASPGSCWKAPGAEAADAELQAVYSPLDRPVVVHGHTHVASVRRLQAPSQTVIDSGSVGLPYDGDRRASYLLLDGRRATIQRVEYDVEAELSALAECGLPGAAWTAKLLRAGSPQMP